MMKAQLLLTVAVAISRSSVVSGFVGLVQSRSSTRIYESTSDNDEITSKQQLRQPDPVEAFMEGASLKGADKVKDMSISERTKRAMLAEAVEDRIFNLYDDLEVLMKDGIPPTDEKRDEISSLAQQIKASQTQYENLVTGEPSEIMDMMRSESDEK